MNWKSKSEEDDIDGWDRTPVEFMQVNIPSLSGVNVVLLLLGWKITEAVAPRHEIP